MKIRCYNHKDYVDTLNNILYSKDTVGVKTAIQTFGELFDYQKGVKQMDKYIKIKWQDGTVKENGVNGLQVSDVLKIAKERLIELNEEHSCKENRLTIVSIDNALNYQDMRDHDRKVRKVEGTYHD